MLIVFATEDAFAIDGNPNLIGSVMRGPVTGKVKIDSVPQLGGDKILNA
jgi:hypothetical protein